MTRSTDGEYIDLRWDDAPEWEVVRGHVTDAVFNEAVIGHHGGVEYGPERAGAPRWVWARWALDGCDEWGNAKRGLRLCSKPGRGCFAVTVCNVRVWRTP